MDDYAGVIILALYLAWCGGYSFGYRKGKKGAVPETLEHRFGSKVLAEVSDIQTKRKMIGTGFLISNTLRLKFDGRSDIEIEIREQA